MTDGSRHHRRSIRLRDYDYSQPGAYFITVCAQDRESLFGDVLDGVMTLSEAGQIVEHAWLQTPDLRPNVELDAFVVMPNHFHAIAVIAVDRQAMARGNRGVLQGVLQYAPTNHSRDEAVPAAPAFRSPSQTIGAIVRGFKAATTTQINALRATPSVPVWQRNYYEHVIRDERDLNRIRHYIESNPAHWATDDENPAIVRRAVPPPRKGTGR